MWRLRWIVVGIQSLFPLLLSLQNSDTAAKQDGFSFGCIRFYNALASAVALSDPSVSYDWCFESVLLYKTVHTSRFARTIFGRSLASVYLRVIMICNLRAIIPFQFYI